MFVCKRCGSIKYTTAGKSIHVGLYCGDCGAWVKWLSPSEKVLYKVGAGSELEPVLCNVSTAFVPVTDEKSIKLDVEYSGGTEAVVKVHAFSVKVKMTEVAEFREQLTGTVILYKV
jgi:hypothetical protein